MIRALVQKDLLLFFRNRFFALLTVLGLVFYIAVYWLMPATPDDHLGLALYIQNAATSPIAQPLANTLEAKLLDSEDALKTAVNNGTYAAGVVLSTDSLAAIQRGDNVQIPVYYAPGTTKELYTALTDVLTVALNNLNVGSGTLNMHINEQEEVLGADLSGIAKPIALRDRMLPTFVLLLLVVETMGLATLIAEEIERRTAQALLVTPLTTGRFFLGKAIMGVGLAFAEVLILVVATGKISTSPLILIVTLLVGSILITGIAFLIASVAKEMMSAMAWGMLALIILAIPAVIVVFPAIGSDWIKVIPSYYLVDTIHHTLNFGAGWADVLPNLMVLLVVGLAVLGVGSLVLRRRFQ